MKPTATEVVVNAVQARGGVVRRAEVMRVIAPRLGVVGARDAVRLAVAARYVAHDAKADTPAVVA